MKKQAIIVAAVVLAAVVSSQAQSNDVAVVVPLTFSGQLSGGSGTIKTKITDATLGGSLVFAEVQRIRNGSTGTPFEVIGSGVTLSNIVVGGTTGSVVVGKSYWESDDSVELSKSSSKQSKTIATFSQSGVDLLSGSAITNLTGIISNSTLLAQTTASASTKTTNVNSKVQGIWVAGTSSVKGTFKSTK